MTVGTQDPLDRAPLAWGVLNTRTVLISDPIDASLTKRVIAQLLWMDSDNAEKPIKVLINSPGGSADDGFAIYDALRFIHSPVWTIAIGISASAATLVMLGAPKGNRLVLPNARIMIHQPSLPRFGAGAEDMRRWAEQALGMRDRINRLYSRETGKALQRVAADTDRDYWMSAEEAVDYGLVDRVIESLDDLQPARKRGF